MNPAQVERSTVRQLTDLPNVGPAMAKDLRLVGIRVPGELVGKDPYGEKLQQTIKKSKMNDAIKTGFGELNGYGVVIGVMDFNFIGGSMGSVVGEKIKRAVDKAMEKHFPLIIVCASGGARMQEGLAS